MIHLSLSIQNLNKNVKKKKIETHFSLKNTLTTCYVHRKKISWNWQNRCNPQGLFKVAGFNIVLLWVWCECNGHKGWGEAMSCIEDVSWTPHPVSSSNYTLKTHPLCGVTCWPEAEIRAWQGVQFGAICFLISASISAVVGYLETWVVTSMKAGVWYNLACPCPGADDPAISYLQEESSRCSDLESSGFGMSVCLC